MREKISNLFRNMNPIVLILLLIMLAENMLSSSISIGEWIYTKLMLLPGIVIGLSFHEAAHAVVSYKLGDPTPKLQGRVTLNPFRHFDVAGFICLLFIGFGWGVPVQINPRYYKNRRLGEFFVSMAGVTANFLIAVIFSFGAKWIANHMSYEFYETLGGTLIEILFYVVYINIVLMIFNLLPVPPLDGFSVVTQIFNLQKYDWYYTVYRNGYFILMILVIFNLPSRIIGPVSSLFLSWLL